MGWLQAGIALALSLGTGALYVALRRTQVEPTATDRAFKRLEGDVEDLFTRVESHLGRISRLKRGAIPQNPPPQETVKEPAKRLSRAELLGKYRRNNAESHRHGSPAERTQ